MPMLVKFYQSHPENPFHPDSNKLELKCVTSVNKKKIQVKSKKIGFIINIQIVRAPSLGENRIYRGYQQC